jgi:kynureninase
MNSLTVNLHLLMASFFRPQGRRRRIVIEAGAFSSDRHAVVGQLRWHGLDPDADLIEVTPPPGEDLIDLAQLEDLLARRGAEVALVLWPGVQYRTGHGFDLAHAIGNTPLALHDGGADFAAWCGYKYLNGGPGALAGAFVHERHAQSDLPRLAGWWGHDHASRFRMEPVFKPGAGADGWQVSNPPILSTAPLLASLALFEEAGMAALRAKAMAMGDFLLNALDTRFADTLQVVTPRAAADRGCQLSLRVRAGRERGRAAFDALTQAGVIADWREPDIIRIAPVPLYNSFTDIARCLQQLQPALA